jgi:hypothetical protein
MKAGLETARVRLTRLATTRLLSAGPEACERIEHQAVVAIERSDWRAARMSLHLRLKMRCAPTTKERAQIERILKLIDQAEEQGIGSGP